MATTYRCIGKGVTDENGVAHMTHSTSDDGETWTDISSNPGYVGTGKGLVDLCASPDAPADISSGSVQSKPYTVFDCPVYDGDNTPTSISWSKTNNAVVTDEVVSLVASVLNTNNNPCINIPVVFKQGNTVLGTAYTDCTGDATITYTWADSDIFNVTAQVGSSLSEDLTMFVKDKSNLLSFNQWSCGDYSNNLDGFSNSSGTPILTHELSFNGNSSIKLTEGNVYVRYIILESQRGKSLNFSCDIYNKDIENAQIFIYSAPYTALRYVVIPISNDFELISTTITVPSNSENITCMITLNAGNGELYLDNLNLKIQ